MSLDGNGFTVARLGDNIASQIWKGSWWKRDDITVEAPNSNTVEYLTPSTILMGRVGIKYLDLSRCSVKRKAEILRHKAREGEILITRSGSRGSLGRVAIVGRTLLGRVLSDDLIRVWIVDVDMRTLMFAFVYIRAAQS